MLVEVVLFDVAFLHTNQIPTNNTFVHVKLVSTREPSGSVLHKIVSTREPSDSVLPGVQSSQSLAL